MTSALTSMDTMSSDASDRAASNSRTADSMSSAFMCSLAATLSGDSPALIMAQHMRTRRVVSLFRDLLIVERLLVERLDVGFGFLGSGDGVTLGGAAAGDEPFPGGVRREGFRFESTGARSLDGRAGDFGFAREVLDKLGEDDDRLLDPRYERGLLRDLRDEVLRGFFEFAPIDRTYQALDAGGL